MKIRVLLNIALSLIALGGLVAFGTMNARAAYYDEPHVLDVTGPYTQAASGMVFPLAVGDFQLTDVISYNSERTDESVSYLLEKDGKKIAISVYVYPVPGGLGTALIQAVPKEDLVSTFFMLSEQLFDDEKQTIAELHRGAQLLNEGETSMTQGGIAYPGYVASYRYGEDFLGDVQPVRSLLYLFPMVRGDWMVKYRVTYPDATDGAAQTTAFLHALNWTIRESK